MKRIYSILTLLFCAINLSLAQSTFEVDGICYKVVKEADEANLFGLVEVYAKPAGTYQGDIAIPNATEHDGDSYKVIGISNGAFSSSRSLTSVSLPASIEYIGENAFQGCESLYTVRLTYGNLTTIGPKAFFESGIQDNSFIFILSSNISKSSLIYLNKR